MDESQSAGAQRRPRPASATPMVSRRNALGAVGLGVAGLAAGGGFFAAAGGSSGSEAQTLSGAHLTVADWRRQRGPSYFIAHRGSGDVYPEHSFPAYDAALAWGAQAMEVSVQRTSDGVLICMHDDTYDRTTTLKGAVAGQSSTVLDRARLIAPHLGPAWASPTLDNLLRIPRFEEVLQRYGGRLVLCVDAKDGTSFGQVMALIKRYGLTRSVIAKVYASSSNIAKAQQLGVPVFGYFGTAVGAADIQKLAKALDPAHDYLVITPSDSNVADTDIAAVRAAVSTGVPTWVGPLHRRYEVQRYFTAGATGAVCASYGYQTSQLALTTEDAWMSRALVSGEMTKTPGQDKNVPRWTGTADLTLSISNAQQFITFGNLGPVEANIYTVTFDVRWNVLPIDLTSYVSFAFGHADDRYYEARSGQGDGFHGILRANGSLELYSHTDGQQVGTKLAPAAATPKMITGDYVSLRLDVAATRLTWSRVDGPKPISVAAKAALHGGYLHFGRTSNDSKSSVSIRNLVVKI